jgi:hypothetical protein
MNWFLNTESYAGLSAGKEKELKKFLEIKFKKENYLV